jgi:crossover junction endodeoxyribonuclease RuvC
MQAAGNGPAADLPVRILGIDPGLRRAGWGLVCVQGSRLSFEACGTVLVPAAGTLAERLQRLYEGLETVVLGLRPAEAAVEETFVNANPASALKLGQARGVALLAPARAGVPVAEYAATVVKKTIVGSGGADKKQIRMMVQVLLPRADPQSEDAADALAIAITHAQHRGLRRLEGR